MGRGAASLFSATLAVSGAGVGTCYGRASANMEAGRAHSNGVAHVFLCQGLELVLIMVMQQLKPFHIMKQHRFLTVALASSLLFAACTKNVKEVEEVAPEESTLNFQMTTAEQSNEVTTTGKVQSGPISWSEGYVYFSDITVEAVRGKQMLSFRSNIAQRFNVFDVLSTIGRLNLPSGKFDRLLFKVKIAPLSSYRALQLKGTYTSNGVTTPIVVEVKEPLTFTFDHRRPITFNPREVMNSFINFTLTPISSGITETMLNNAVKTNGVIVISHTSNAKLYNMIGDGLKKVFNIRIS